MKHSKSTNTSFTPHKTIPGPHALLGWRVNLLKFYRNPLTYSYWLYKTYGNFVSLKKGDPSYIFAFGPELNYQLLTNPDLFGANATFLNKLPKENVLGRMFFNNLSLMTGEKHKQHRRLIQPAFHKQQIVQYLNDMVTLTNQLLDDWQEQSIVDINLEMKKLTQRIAIKTLFGLYNEIELDHVGKLIERMTKSLPLVTLIPINFPGTPYHRTLRIAEQLDAFIRSMIVQKRRQSNATDVLASLIDAHDEGGARLSDEELIGHTFSLFVAGHETTANALTWAIFLLCQHPKVLADLVDELSGTLHGSPPTIEKLPQLPLLDGVVKESLRLLPPASIGTKITNAPCNLGGFELPKGSNIIFSQFITHRLPDLYDKPNRFQPERWATLKRSPYEYLPFSAGPHMCIGWSFAMQELKVVLATLLQRYRLSVIPNTKIEPNLLMRPKYGMPMQLFPQDRQFHQVPVRGAIHQLIEFAEH